MMSSGRSPQTAASSAEEAVGRDPESASWREGWLRTCDQGSVVVAAVACLMVMAFIWWLRGGVDGSWRDIDGASPQKAKFHVDVNRAEWPELSQLPGIGPKLASRWVADRETHGLYASHGELQRIPGIGPRTLERMLPFLGPIEAIEENDQGSHPSRAMTTLGGESPAGGD